jgi:hypothetical protein
MSSAETTKAGDASERRGDPMNLRRMLKVLGALVAAMGLSIGVCMAVMPHAPAPALSANGSPVYPAGMARLWPWQCIIIHAIPSDPRNGAARADELHRQEGDAEAEVRFHFIIGAGSGAADGAIRSTSSWLHQRPGVHCYVEEPLPTVHDFAGVDAYNRYGIGIAIVGDFSAHPPSEAQMDSLADLVAELTRKCGISLSRVLAHGELESVACPGAAFSMSDLLRRVGEKYRRAASE